MTLIYLYIQGSHQDWKAKKTWENWWTFSSQEKSGNFDQTGKVREFYPKYWKSMKNDLINKLKKKYECFSAACPKLFLASPHLVYLF